MRHSTSGFHGLWIQLLLGSLQLIAVYPFPNFYYYFFHSFLMKSITWIFHHFCGLLILFLPCCVDCQIFFGQETPHILRRCPYYFSCLRIPSKIDCSSCILFLMAEFEIFCIFKLNLILNNQFPDLRDSFVLLS